MKKSPNLSKCPLCGGVADNGHDREYPPNPYVCTKCEEVDKRISIATAAANSDKLAAQLDKTT